MKYIWTEDTGAGLHFWELVNEYLFHCELTENDEWSVKGRQMGDCWHKDCCVKQNNEKSSCGIHEGMTGVNKLAQLFADWEVSKL